MPQAWSSQDNDDPDDIDSWMAWRNRQLSLGPEADAVARDLWNQGTWGGVNVQAPNPSDLTALGLAALSGDGAYPSTAPYDGDDGDGAPYPSTVGGNDRGGPLPPTESDHRFPQETPPPGIQASGPTVSPPSGAAGPWVSEFDVIGRRTSPPHPGFFDSLNHSLPARIAGGVFGYAAGLPSGVVRGGWHALEGLGDGVNFARSLLSPEGRAKAWDEAKTATHDALEYGRSANPARLASDAMAGGAAAIHSLVPFTTPMADSAWGEMKHEFGTGMNAGETAANVAGLVAAPEVFEGLNAVRTFDATREANAAKFMAQGFDEPTARYLSKPYAGQAEHAVIPQRQDSIAGVPIPGLRNVPIPDWIMDSPLNVSRPRGMSQGDFYEYHFGVDPHFYGAGLPRSLNGGKGWSGKRLGMERYSGAGRMWARTPQVWKDYYTGVALGDALGQLPADPSEAPQ